MNLLHILGTFFAVVGAVCGWYFTISYGRVINRSSGEVGWHLLSFTSVIAAALTWISARLVIIGQLPQERVTDQVARVVIFGAIAALLLWRASILIRTQRRDRAADLAEADRLLRLGGKSDQLKEN